MKTLRTAAWMVPAACLLVSLTANAGEHTSRTHFGPPGAYTKVPHTPNPWSTRVVGLPVCQTRDARYADFLRDYQLVEAQHEARLRHLRWSRYRDYVNPPRSSLDGFLGNCNARGCVDNGNRGCDAGCADGCRGKKAKRGLFMGKKSCKSACDDCGPVCNTGCASDSCGGCANRADGCGSNKTGLLHVLGRHFKRPYGRSHRTLGPSQPSLPPGYPPMNREDATRYIEGFQYYPPYQIIRSPRDFFMWDTTKDLGR